MIRMTVDMFMRMLLICSAMTGLITEALKKFIKNDTNILAGVVSVAVAVVCAIGYFLMGNPITPLVIFYLFCLAIMSWLCAMVGYDKVIQTIAQIRKGDK